MPKFESPWVTPSGQPQSGEKYLNAELKADIEVFPAEARPLVMRFLNGEKLTSHDQAKVDAARDEWWQDKYGFPFSLASAREEVLRRNHFPQGEQKAFILQQEFLRAQQAGKDDVVKMLKKRYQEEFPEQLEGVEALFGLAEFLKKQKSFDEARGRKEGRLPETERTNMFRDFTEYQFLFTHFIINAAEDRKFLEDFWAVGEAIAKGTGCLKEMQKLRRSLVSQAAVYHILKEIGDKPNLSHPDEDAFNAVDLWADHKTAIQIKGWNEEDPALFESDHLVFPSAQTGNSGKQRMFSSLEYFRGKNYQFIGKIKKYGKVIKRDLSGYMMVVPYSKIDFVTGEPARELVDFFKEQMKQVKA